MRPKALLPTLLSVLVAPLGANAVTLATSADAYVERGTPTTNHGTKDHLRVKHDSGTFVRKTYTRHDLASLAFDHTTDLQSATLKLDFVDLNVGLGGTTIDWTFEVYGLLDGDAGENWDETTIDWNNAPQNDTTDGKAMLAGVVSLGTFSFIGRTASVDFTGTAGTAVRDFVAASTSDDLVTFVVVRDTIQPSGTHTYVHTMYSKEHATQSALAHRLELTQIPEPSAAGLTLFAILALTARRRR